MKLVYLFSLLLFSRFCFSQMQELPYKSLDLSSFNTTMGKGSVWRLAGDISGHYTSPHFKVRNGDGIIVGTLGKKVVDTLKTNIVHQDLSIKLYFAVTKGAKAHILLQGKYKLNLSDSWGPSPPTFKDCGGIEMQSPAFTEGYAPRINSAKAPGLWQKIEIRYQAAKILQSQGGKSGRMVKVILNDNVVHENVELPGLNYKGISQQSLSFVLEAGSLALRDIQYKIYKEDLKASLTDLSFKYYEGKYETIPDLSSLQLALEGTSPVLSWEYGKSDNKFLFEFQGLLHVPVDGQYLLTTIFSGVGKLYVNGQELIFNENHERNVYKSHVADLKKGSHPFKMYFSKHFSWLRPTMGVFIEGPEMAVQELHAPSSISIDNSTGPILLHPSKDPRIQRSFVRWKDKIKTTALSVGEPVSLNYSIDLSTGALLQVWRGPFANVTSMWHNRGEGQTLETLGAPTLISAMPVLADISDYDQKWPDSLDEKDFRRQGYVLTSQRRPLNQYTYRSLSLSDEIGPDPGNFYLTRTLTFSGDTIPAGLFCLLGEGKSIKKLKRNTYSVDDNQYYIEILKGNKAAVRNSAGRSELIVPVGLQNKKTIKYSVIW